ncbi:MAG: hypothetical protein ACR2NL_00360, partial [Acidimicrobiia bacterium]
VLAAFSMRNVRIGPCRAAVLAMFAPGATVDRGELIDGLDEMASTVDWYAALEWDWTPTECAEVASGSATTVTCSYTHANAWTRALDVGPFNAGEAVYVIEDGLITSYSYDLTSSGFSQHAWNVFVRWTADNHPDEIVVIVPDRCCTPSMTPEAIVLWEEFTAEFVAEQAG